MDSVGEGEGGKIRENGIETNKKQQQQKENTNTYTHTHIYIYAKLN